MMRVKFEGGKANGTCCGTSHNCRIIVYGQKGNEETYFRTMRTDTKGRVIFALNSSENQSPPSECACQ